MGKRVNAGKVDQLVERIQRDVDAGFIPAGQVALAIDGEVVFEQAFGSATPDTRFCFFSATKPFTAAAVWVLLGRGELDERLPVTTWFPEFGATGKADITLEQVMLHTAGFPTAPMGPNAWGSRATRTEKMASWRLTYEPGTQFIYHPTAAHWVLGEIIESVTGMDYRDAIEQLVTTPLGLPRIVGIPLDQQQDIAPLQLIGDPAAPDELEAAFGVRELPATEVTDEAVTRFNEPVTREVGIPGGGGFGRAHDLAAFHQALLHDTTVFKSELLADVTGRVRNRLPDPTGVPANRSLGLILAGDDGRANVRGFGRTVSPRTFGHNGAGGQIAWGDPESGLSLGFVTSGYDRHEIRGPKRTTAIGSLAGACAE